MNKFFRFFFIVTFYLVFGRGIVFAETMKELLERIEKMHMLEREAAHAREISIYTNSITRLSGKYEKPSDSDLLDMQELGERSGEQEKIVREFFKHPFYINLKGDFFDSVRIEHKLVYKKSKDSLVELSNRGAFIEDEFSRGTKKMLDYILRIHLVTTDDNKAKLLSLEDLQTTFAQAIYKKWKAIEEKAAQCILKIPPAVRATSNFQNEYIKPRRPPTLTKLGEFGITHRLPVRFRDNENDKENLHKWNDDDSKKAITELTVGMKTQEKIILQELEKPFYKDIYKELFQKIEINSDKIFRKRSTFYFHSDLQIVRLYPELEEKSLDVMNVQLYSSLDESVEYLDGFSVKQKMVEKIYSNLIEAQKKNEQCEVWVKNSQNTNEKLIIETEIPRAGMESHQ